MASNTLARYETQDGIELVINQQTGEAFATRNGLSRMCNVAPSTITKWKGSSQIPTFEAEIHTAGGLQGGSLFNEDAILQALEIYNSAMLLNFAKLGLRMSLHQIAGFKMPSAEKATPTVESSLTDKELLKTFTDLYARATRTGNKRLLLIAENNIADIAEKINPGSDSYDATKPDYSKLNPVERFIASKVQVTNHWDDKVLSSELYDAFVKWNGSPSISRSKFTKTVVSLRIADFQEKMCKDKTRTSGFRGIKIIND